MSVQLTRPVADRMGRDIMEAAMDGVAPFIPTYTYVWAESDVSYRQYVIGVHMEFGQSVVRHVFQIPMDEFATRAHEAADELLERVRKAFFYRECDDVPANIVLGRD